MHLAQLMPLPLTVSCFSKIQIGLPFWYRLAWVVLDKGPLNGSISLRLSVCLSVTVYIALRVLDSMRVFPLLCHIFQYRVTATRRRCTIQ